MKIVVFGGSGKMGAAVAWDLVKQDDVEQVGISGRREASLDATKAWIGSPKVKAHVLDITDRKAAQAVMADYDVGVIALPDRRTSYLIVDAAIAAGLHIVDMLEEYHRRPDPYETEGLIHPEGMSLNEYGDYLHEQALDKGVTFLDGIGFAPGISNITVAQGIRKLDKAVSAVARVGGIPSKESAERHPLKYMITWSFDHVLREYMILLDVRKGGEVVEVDALSDRETFRFNAFGVDETLVCAVTPGMPSFLYSRPGLENFAEKTVRWPGHFAAVESLKEIGMLDLDPVQVQDVKIAPRDFLLKVIEPRLLPEEGDTDVCVMWNTVQGVKDGKPTRVDYYMWDTADTENGISSMARVTGFSSAIGALAIGRGIITERGIVPPEDALDSEGAERFLDELADREIRILEEIAPDVKED
jgi:saccharopine dehydrogenase-like NADP-dependent oxidoreductase